MSAIVSDTPQKHSNAHNKVTSSSAGSETDYGRHLLLPPDVHAEIKNEPPEDIDDSHGIGGGQVNGNGTLMSRMPTIKLTPTMKLLASPNPVDPKRKFPCPYDNCTKSYGKSSHLRSHLTWHTGIKPYVCQEPNCGKSFTRSDELNRHSRTHTGEKPFECMQCAKKFSRSDHLTKHVATHTKQMQTLKRRPPGNADNSGAQAGKKALTELTEMSHVQGMNYNDGMHFMASLLECAQFKHGRHVIEPENLTAEPVIAHMPIKIKLERPENSEEYKVVNSHKKATPAPAPAASQTPVAPQPPATVPVPQAPMTIVPRTALNMPTNAVPSVTQMSPPRVVNAALHDGDIDGENETNDNTIMPEANAPPLPQAGAPYAVPRFGLFEEETEVDPDRPYRCSECVKCFKRQDDLNRHVRTHTGEKPFSCTHCERRFMRSDHLKKHLKTHTKER